MSGNNMFLDTNAVLYLLNGDEKLAELLYGNQLFISFITEIELLGYKNLSQKDLGEIKNFISLCTVIDMNKDIKLITIDLRSKYSIKLGDSMIAATSIYFELPLVTADKHFEKISELNLILYKLIK